ncbi:Homoserine/homoserine lactone efflux protein [Acinetobacter baumannii]|nr:Homoserine/homoserine lactone efflux protein [Acinetobacter baumannii]
MSGLLVFITIAFLTLSSPGPGVLFTVTNSINYGVRTALFGISGLIIGMFIIAVISASGVGLIITSNPTIFTALKFIGAFYLMYLGYKNFIKKSPTQDLLETEHNEKEIKKSKLFYQGLFASLLNPKTIVFLLPFSHSLLILKRNIKSVFGFIFNILLDRIFNSFSLCQLFLNIQREDACGNNFSKLNKVSGCIFFF